MIKKRIIICILTAVLLALSVFVSVGFDQPKESPFYVEVLSDNGTERINCWKNEEGEYYVFLPGYAELSHTKVYLNTENKLSINGNELNDGENCDKFELDVKYDLTCSYFGGVKKSALTFVSSERIATMYIDTKSGSMEYIHSKKGNEESGTISLYNDDGSLNYTGDLEAIGGRGNYTWENFDKKPYSLTLTSDADLLGMGKAQRWILLANADDPSNMRNKIVYDFAKRAGLEYSPDSDWVELYLNGEYAGLYLLCERNELHSQRVEISPDNSFLVSLELEERLVAQNLRHITTEAKQALRVHYPMTVTDAQLKALTKKWQSVENAILAEDGIDPQTGKRWQDLIDLDSWARKYLVEELFGNYDAGLASQYFYCDGKENSGKIYAGPVWDFDHALGNSVLWQLTEPNVLYANRLDVKENYQTPWFYKLCQKEEFHAEVVKLYSTEFLPLIEEWLHGSVKNYGDKIFKAFQLNQIRWPSITNGVTAEGEEICDYISERTKFLCSLWLENETYHILRADESFGTNYTHYFVRSGDTVDYLPQFENTEFSDFVGWYYADTDEPFDISKPIYEDVEIYAKWQNSASNKLDDVIKLIPIALISVIFIVLAVIEIKRMKGKRVTKNG